MVKWKKKYKKSFLSLYHLNELKIDTPAFRQTFHVVCLSKNISLSQIPYWPFNNNRTKKSWQNILSINLRESFIYTFNVNDNEHAVVLSPSISCLLPRRCFIIVFVSALKMSLIKHLITNRSNKDSYNIIIAYSIF